MSTRNRWLASGQWHLLFTRRGRIGPLWFLVLGSALALIKFAIDRLFDLFAGHPWTTDDLLGARLIGTYVLGDFHPTGNDYGSLILASLVAIVFAYWGVMIVLARLRSAGLSPFWVLVFFVPVLKFIFFAVLAIVPARDGATPVTQVTSVEPSPRLVRWIPRSEIGAAILSILLVSLVGFLFVSLGTEFLGNYGYSLFVGIPFALGFVSALIYCLPENRTQGGAMLVSTLSIAAAGGVLLLVRVEGVLCLLMAAPLAVPLSILGGLVAHTIVATIRAARTHNHTLAAVLFIMPSSLVLENQIAPPAPLLKVVTAVEINAPPSVVWKNVVTFSELPTPTEWVFRTGVAYPVRATIEGQGPGAIRRCEFSTGPFVEPITVWDEPHLLRFRVTENPAPLQEWTPYRAIHPPHLDGYLVSRQGQFLLTELPGGRTRLEGTTWYQHHLWPVDYWQVLSDFIIHTIHDRVLRHIQALSEGGR